MGASLTAAAAKTVRSLENPSPEGAEHVETMNPLDARLSLLDQKVGLYVERFGVTEGELGALHKRIRAARNGLEDKTRVADEAERMLASTQFETKIETDAKDPLLKEKVETAFGLIQFVRANKQEKLETIGVERAGEFVTDAKLLAAIKKDPAVWQSIKLRAAEGSSVAKAFADPAVRLDTPEGRAAYAEATGQDAEKAWGWVKDHKVATAAIVLGGIAVLSWLMSSKKDPAVETTAGKKEEKSYLPWIAGLGAIGLGLAAWQMDRVEAGMKKAEELAAAARAKFGFAGDTAKSVMAKGQDMVSEAQHLAGKDAPHENAKDEFDQHTNMFAERILANPAQGRDGELQYRLVRSMIKGGGFTQAQKDFEAMATKLESGQKLSSEDLRQISGYTQGKWWIEKLEDGALTIVSAGGYFVYRVAKEELHVIANTASWVMSGFAAKEGADLWEQYRDVGMYVMGATTLKEIFLGNPHFGTMKRIMEAGKKLRYGAAWPFYAPVLLNDGIKTTGENMQKLAAGGRSTFLGSMKMGNGVLNFFDASGKQIAKLTLGNSVLKIWESGKWVTQKLTGRPSLATAIVDPVTPESVATSGEHPVAANDSGRPKSAPRSSTGVLGSSGGTGTYGLEAAPVVEPMITPEQQVKVAEIETKIVEKTKVKIAPEVMKNTIGQLTKVLGPAMAILIMERIADSKDPIKTTAEMGIYGTAFSVGSKLTPGHPVLKLVGGLAMTIGVAFFGQEKMNSAFASVQEKYDQHWERKNEAEKGHWLQKKIGDVFQFTSLEFVFDTTYYEFFKGEDAFAYFSDTTMLSQDTFSTPQRGLYRGLIQIPDWNADIEKKIQKQKNKIQESELELQKIGTSNKKQATEISQQIPTLNAELETLASQKIERGSRWFIQQGVLTKQAFEALAKLENACAGKQPSMELLRAREEFAHRIQTYKNMSTPELPVLDLVITSTPELVAHRQEIEGRTAFTWLRAVMTEEQYVKAGKPAAK